MFLAPAFSQAEQISDTISAHLAAGEFQSAVKLAESVENEATQQSLLQQIANAQTSNNELAAAQSTIRHMQKDQSRVNVAARKAAKQTMQGTGADFDSLISLIRSQTGGEETWDDLGGLGTTDEFEAGIRVDPTGLLVRMTTTESNNRLKELGLTSRKADLNADMAQAAPLRMVSLTRLEKAVAARLAEGQPIVESMQNLAGLYSIQYVFVYPETGEIVIAGPASGWEYANNGWAVSDQTGTPTLQLDDLVTVLRTFSPEGEGIFGCSINPRQEGMKDLKEYVESSQQRGALSASAVRGWARTLQRKLGLQDVLIYGVPADSRVARVLVEADYRMKLIGIGKLEAGSQIPDYFDLMTEQEVTNVSSLDALRWWLSVKCESILKSEDSDAFQIQGSSVLCQSENQFISNEGQQVQTGKSEATNRAFAENLTEHYQRLAEQDVVFADLQNIFDLALTAALIHKEQLTEATNWDAGVFASNGDYQPTRYEAPEVVDSVVNHKVFNGKNIVVQVAGGVRVDANQFASAAKSSVRLNNAAENSEAPELPAGRWWWDAQK